MRYIFNLFLLVFVVSIYGCSTDDSESQAQIEEEYELEQEQEQPSYEVSRDNFMHGNMQAIKRAKGVEQMMSDADSQRRDTLDQY